MKLDQITRHCHPDRLNMSKPWSDGEWTYATNGVSLIRVPRMDDIGAVDWAPNTTALFRSLCKQSKDAVPLAEIDIPAAVPCKTCKGKPVGLFECDSCGGAGECECFHCGGIQDCDDCDGKGVLQVCPTCNGRGEAKRQCVHINGVSFDAHYLRFFADLPGAVITTNENRPARVDFDGGVGAIMPMREEKP